MLLFALFVILIFVVIVSLISEDNNDNESVKWAYVGILCLLVLLVGFRPPGFDTDSQNYVNYYEAVDIGVVELIEPTFDIISSFARIFDEPQLIFIIYALLAIPLKGYAITKLTPLWFLSLAVWMSNYFILHEFTQIRTAVATAIFLYAFYYLLEKRRWVYVWLILLASLFHYSALILLPLAVLGTNPFNSCWRLLLLISPLLCYGFYFMGIDPMTLIPIPLFQEKMDIYEQLRDTGVDQALNVFNMMVLFRLASYYFILWKSREIAKSCPSVYLMLKVMCLSICFYAFFAYMPSMGMRTSEVFGVIDILILPTMIYAVKPELVVKIALGVLSIGLFVMNIFVNHLLNATS